MVTLELCYSLYTGLSLVTLTSALQPFTFKSLFSLAGSRQRDWGSFPTPPLKWNLICRLAPNLLASPPPKFVQQSHQLSRLWTTCSSRGFAAKIQQHLPSNPTSYAGYEWLVPNLLVASPPKYNSTRPAIPPFSQAMNDSFPIFSWLRRQNACNSNHAVDPPATQEPPLWLPITASQGLVGSLVIKGNKVLNVSNKIKKFREFCHDHFGFPIFTT